MYESVNPCQDVSLQNSTLKYPQCSFKSVIHYMHTYQQVLCLLLAVTQDLSICVTAVNNWLSGLFSFLLLCNWPGWSNRKHSNIWLEEYKSQDLGWQSGPILNQILTNKSWWQLKSDDLVLLSTSKTGLQSNIDRLNAFCKSWAQILILVSQKYGIF